MHTAHALYLLSSHQFVRQQIKWIIICRHQTETKSIFHQLSPRSLRSKINYIGRERTHFESL